jgi:hypothetical protein
MGAKHTPGPWHRDGQNLSSIIRCVTPKGHPDAKHVCGDYEVIARCEGDNWEANARLIAAAPDMLEALQRAHSFMCASGIDPEHSVRQAVVAAIARAEGRSA